MAAEHEALVEKSSGPMSEDTWWALFRTLIPGMQSRDIESLRMEFWPYYLSDMSLTIPSLSFSEVTFSDMAEGVGMDTNQTNVESQMISVPIFETEAGIQSLDTNMLLIQTRSESRPEGILPGPVPATPLPTQDLNIAPSRPVDTASNSATSHDTSNTSQADSSQNTTPTTSANTTPTSIGTCNTTTPGSSSIITAQSRRNFQRLQAKNQRAENTIASLRETNKLTQEGVGRADVILEEIFALEQDEDIVIPAAIYDKLALMSEIFVGIGERLR